MKGQDPKLAAVIDREVKKGGFRGRINAMCCSCIYDPYSDGTWRKQVEECTSLACPLYPIRPVSDYQKEKASENTT